MPPNYVRLLTEPCLSPGSTRGSHGRVGGPSSMAMGSIKYDYGMAVGLVVHQV